MGRAILWGLLERNGSSVLRDCRFEASVSSSSSAQRLQQHFSPFAERCKVHYNTNLQAARDADVILLAFPPSQLSAVLGEPGMGAAVQDKLVISILAGVERAQIQRELSTSYLQNPPTGPSRANIVRVMPTLGAQAYESASVIAVDEPAVPPHLMQLSQKIFQHIGETYTVPGDLFDSMMSLGAAVHGLMAVSVDALLDGTTVAGIPRQHALGFIGQCFRGYATLVSRGKEPAELKNSVMIPKGFTPRAVLTLERRGVRSAISDTVVESVASTRPPKTI